MCVVLDCYISATTRLESKATLSTTYSFWLRDTSPLRKISIQGYVSYNMCVVLDCYISSNNKTQIKGHIIDHIQFLVKEHVAAYAKDFYPRICLLQYVPSFWMVTFSSNNKARIKGHIINHIQFLVRDVAAYTKDCYPGCVADNMYVLLNGYISANNKTRLKGHIIDHIQFLVKEHVAAYIKIAIQGCVMTTCMSF